MSPGIARAGSGAAANRTIIASQKNREHSVETGCDGIAGLLCGRRGAAQPSNASSVTMNRYLVFSDASWVTFHFRSFLGCTISDKKGKKVGERGFFACP